MDIESWIEGVVPAAGQNLDPQLQPPRHVRLKENKQDLLHVPSRKRRRRSPTSSFLEAGASPGRVQRARKESVREAQISSNGRQSSPYKRRARRKPRSDLYAPKVEKHLSKEKRATATSTRNKPGNTRWKRKRNERPSAAQITNFHAKNVSQDRLTLRQGSNIGIFGNAKSSVALRGHELPDLVFTDASFLTTRQKRFSEKPTDLRPSTRRKKRKGKVHGEEISTYFVSDSHHRVAGEKDRARPKRVTKVLNGEGDERKQQTVSSGTNRTRSTTGARDSAKISCKNVKGGTHTRSSSYFSWSSSALSKIDPPPAIRKNLVPEDTSPGRKWFFDKCSLRPHQTIVRSKGEGSISTRNSPVQAPELSIIDKRSAQDLGFYSHQRSVSPNTESSQATRSSAFLSPGMKQLFKGNGVDPPPKSGFGERSSKIRSSQAVDGSRDEQKGSETDRRKSPEGSTSSFGKSTHSRDHCIENCESSDNGRGQHLESDESEIYRQAYIVANNMKRLQSVKDPQRSISGSNEIRQSRHEMALGEPASTFSLAVLPKQCDPTGGAARHSRVFGTLTHHSSWGVEDLPQRPGGPHQGSCEVENQECLAGTENMLSDAELLPLPGEQDYLDDVHSIPLDQLLEFDVEEDDRASLYANSRYADRGNEVISQEYAGDGIDFGGFEASELEIETLGPGLERNDPRKRRDVSGRFWRPNRLY